MIQREIAKVLWVTINGRFPDVNWKCESGIPLIFLQS